MITPEQLDELERLERESTNGPWEKDARGGGVIRGGEAATFVNGTTLTQVALAVGIRDEMGVSGSQDANAAFIVAARNALPELIAAARDMLSKRVALDRKREEARTDAQRKAEQQRDAALDRVKELETECLRLASYLDRYPGDDCDGAVDFVARGLRDLFKDEADRTNDEINHRRIDRAPKR